MPACSAHVYNVAKNNLVIAEAHVATQCPAAIAKAMKQNETELLTYVFDCM